jgi:hypothetical protein
MSFQVSLYQRHSYENNQSHFTKTFNSKDTTSKVECQKKVFAFLRSWHLKSFTKDISNKDFQIFQAFFANTQTDWIEYNTRDNPELIYGIRIFGDKKSMADGQKTPNWCLESKKIVLVATRTLFSNYQKLFSSSSANEHRPRDPLLYAFFNSHSFLSVSEYSSSHKTRKIFTQDSPPHSKL